MVATTFPLAVVISGVDRLTGPLGKMEGRLGKFGASASRVGRDMTLGVTAPIVGFGASTLLTAANFEKGMNRVKALTGSSGDTFDKLREKAKDLGATTAFSASDAAAGMGFLAQAGFKTDQILQGIGPSLQLASAAGIELAEAADVGSNILTGYGIPVENLTGAFDVQTATFTSANTDLTQLGEAFKIAGPVAKSMGLELTETSAILGAMGNAGFQASLAGTALRGALSRLAKPSAEASRELAGLGISRDQILDDAGNVKSLVDVIQLLSDKGATAGNILTIFGERAGPAITALANPEGVKGLKELQSNLEGVGTTGATARIAGVQMEGAAGAVAGLRSAFEGLQIAIAESGLLESFTELVRDLTLTVRRVSETNPQLLKTITIVGGVAAAVGPLVLAIGSVASGFGLMAKGAGLLAVPLKLVGGILFKAVIPAVWSFTAAIIANPIGAIVTGVVALVAAIVLLWKNWDKVSAFLVKTWEFVRKGVGIAIEWLLDKLEKLAQFVIPRPILKLLGLDGGPSLPEGDSIPAEDLAATARGSAAVEGLPGAPGQGGSARVRVEVAAPEGTTIETDGDSDLELDVAQGPAAMFSS